MPCLCRRVCGTVTRAEDRVAFDAQRHRRQLGTPGQSVVCGALCQSAVVQGPVRRQLRRSTVREIDDVVAAAAARVATAARRRPSDDDLVIAHVLEPHTTVCHGEHSSILPGQSR